jgi:putative component of membrane protein insertase Oxa1/YidC/SpoIIIJ protein YidD
VALSREARKRIPIVAIGVLFAFPASPRAGGPSSILARELLAEGDCVYALREARRALSADAGDPSARAVSVAARRRLGLAVGAEESAWFRSVAAGGPGEAAAIAARALSGGGGPAGRRIWSAPSDGVVAVYRRWIAPGIAQRCSLEPSCSQYFLEAGRRHGLLAFPLQADRFVREPAVVKEAARPVPSFGGTRCEDPVGDHDFWLTPPRRAPAGRRSEDR